MAHTPPAAGSFAARQNSPAMHWDLRQARTFVAVAEALSFSAAAGKLNTTQSAVSRTIAGMESDLGVQLLTRTTRNVGLTAEGRLLLEDCREIVAHFERWTSRARRLADGTSGLIALGLNDFAILAEVPTLLNRFRSVYPEIQFAFYSEIRDVLFRHLESGKIEVGFVMGPFVHPKYSTALSAEYQINCFVHRDHPFAVRSSVSLAEIAKEPLVLGSTRGWRTYRSMLASAFEAAGVAMPLAQEVEESVSIFGLVAGGCGITLYPNCGDQLRLRDVSIVPISDLREKVQTIAVWSDETISKAGRLFVEFCFHSDREASGPVDSGAA